MSGEFQRARDYFPIDTATHKVTILHDDGVNRHIVFQKANGSSDMRFDLITYKGGLVYRGDMGCYVFERVPDMLGFFRSSINPHYWGEKLEAICRRDGYRNFDLEKFKEAVLERVEEMQQEMSEHDALMFFDEVDGGLHCIESEAQAIVWIQDFQYKDQDDNYIEFQDFLGEVTIDTFSYRYSWACLAISWGIEQYDLLKRQSLKYRVFFAFLRVFRFFVKPQTKKGGLFANIFTKGI